MSDIKEIVDNFEKIVNFREEDLLKQIATLTKQLEIATEALEFYAEGEPCCIVSDNKGCSLENCEYPKCAEKQFPVWDRGRIAKKALSKLKEIKQ